MALILVVEDDRGIGDLFDEILGSLGHCIIHAEDGQAALTLARIHHPDLILMDLMLPVLDGIEATRLLKNDRQTTDIRVIAMSASAPLLRRVQECPVDHVLAKPFDLRMLMDLVDGCLPTRGAAD